MMNRVLFLTTSFLLLILSSCTGTRYSSESILKDVDFNNIDRIEISYYFSELRRESDTSFNEIVYSHIINSPLIIELSASNTEYLMMIIKQFLNSFPSSRNRNFSQKELMEFKKKFLKEKNIDTLDIDSLFNMPIQKRATRNILSYTYRIKFLFHSEDEKSLSIWKISDNILNYSFCCTDFENDWFYRNLKGYTAYSLEYILDIEFQKRYVEMFNSVLSYYNKTNETDYPLLDVEYEIWSGIIRDY